MKPPVAWGRLCGVSGGSCALSEAEAVAMLGWGGQVVVSAHQAPLGGLGKCMLGLEDTQSNSDPIAAGPMTLSKLLRCWHLPSFVYRARVTTSVGGRGGDNDRSSHLENACGECWINVSYYDCSFLMFIIIF